MKEVPLSGFKSYRAPLAEKLAFLLIQLPRHRIWPVGLSSKYSKTNPSIRKSFLNSLTTSSILFDSLSPFEDVKSDNFLFFGPGADIKITNQNNPHISGARLEAQDFYFSLKLI